MRGSLHVPFDEKSIEIDTDFRGFYEYCINNNIPFNVISARLKPILRGVLDIFLGEERSAQIKIVANDAQIADDGSVWKPIWRHDNELGHDKVLSVQEARREAELQCEDGTIPLIVFIGDGDDTTSGTRDDKNMATVSFLPGDLTLVTISTQPNEPGLLGAKMPEFPDAIDRADEGKWVSIGMDARGFCQPIDLSTLVGG